ncbi:MAG: SRPBCC family protein [Acidimicrobiales bacterium]
MKVERSIELPAPPGEVWLALVEPDRLASWFGGHVELDARPGGRVVVADEDGERWGTVESFEPGQRLVLRLWQRGESLTGSRLAFVLEGDGDGTRLTVVESQSVLGGGGARPFAMGRRG